MPEAILPTIGIAIAAIGLLVTVRNGIDLILRDKDHIKDFIVTDLIQFRVRISLLGDRLILWKRFWSIYDGMKADYFVTLWGDSGAKEIRELLATIEQLSTAIGKEFESKYVAKRADKLSRHFDKHEGASEASRLNMLKKLMVEYKKDFKLRKRIKLALFDSPTCQRHYENLKSGIEDLEALSTSKFEIQHHYKYDEQAAKKLGLQAALSEFRSKSASSAKLLFDYCRQPNIPKTTAIDFFFDLAYKSEHKSRNECLHHRAAQGGFPYHLRIVIYESPGEYSEFLKTVTEPYLFKEFITQIPNTQAESHQLVPENDHFLKQRDQRAPRHNSESLSEILSQSSLNLVDSGYHQFPLAERFKVAYELSELALTLLDSAQLHELCICGLHRICVDAAEAHYQHLIRIENIHEFRGSPPGVQDNHRWCQRELLNMHILRLGIVLTEISIGAPVKYAKYDTEAEMVKITLGASGKGSEETEDCSPDMVARFVKESGGEDMSRAVHYCLRRIVTYGEVTAPDFESFYNWVVAPLYLHYENQGLKHGRKAMEGSSMAGPPR